MITDIFLAFILIELNAYLSIQKQKYVCDFVIMETCSIPELKFKIIKRPSFKPKSCCYSRKKREKKRTQEHSVQLMRTDPEQSIHMSVMRD